MQPAGIRSFDILRADPEAPEEEESSVVPLIDIGGGASPTAAAGRWIAASIAAAVGAACMLMVAGYTAAEGGRTGSVQGVVGLHYDTGSLSWKGDDNKTRCLDVDGGVSAPGTKLQVWSCEGDQVNQQFIFPRAHGMIRWRLNTSLCIQAANKSLDEGSRIVLWPCNDTDSSMDWVMPNGTGPIRLTAHPEMCIDERKTNETLQNGVDAFLSSCPVKHDPSHHEAWTADLWWVEGQLKFSSPSGELCLHVDNEWPGSNVSMSWCNTRDLHTQWVFPGRGGLVKWAAHPELCLDVYRGEFEKGNHVQVWHCNETVSSMLWEVPSGPGVFRLARHRHACLRSPELYGQVKIFDCNKTVAANETWDVVKRPEIYPGWPSLYCLSVIRPFGYERDILAQSLAKAPDMHKDLGIFACNDFQVFSSKAVTVGWQHKKGWVVAAPFDSKAVGVSKDGTAGNAELFMSMWSAVKYLGDYNAHDWTVKIDPDAVLFPDRMRGHLAGWTTHAPAFVTNCNDHPGNPDYPMIYGAVEAYSKEGLQKYFAMENQCRTMDWRILGEDLFMERCFKMLGATQQFDGLQVGDMLCNHQVNCNEGQHAAFHPFKSVDAWMGCWYQANA